MKVRDLDPRRLDVVALARAGARLDGTWPLDGFGRLADVQPTRSPGTGVNWSATGRIERPRGGAEQVWLELHAQAEIALVCQRCLEPCRCRLSVEQTFRFVADEREAERLDAESEHDVLALPKELDLHELLEDELLLALPIVPRHPTCPQPLASAAAAGEPQPEATRHPFAALASLRRRPGA